MDTVYEFFGIKILLLGKSCLQPNNNYQNFVVGVVFDIHQVKWGSTLQKTVPGGLTISSLIGGIAVFSAGTHGSDHTFQTLERFLISPYRHWKELYSGYLDYTTELIRP